MAQLNKFTTAVAKLSTLQVDQSQNIIYTVPGNKTTVVLLAQIANLTDSPGRITFLHSINGTETHVVKNLGIAGNDSLSVLEGKLVVEKNNYIKAYANEDNKFEITLSVLESLNES